MFGQIGRVASTVGTGIGQGVEVKRPTTAPANLSQTTRPVSAPIESLSGLAVAGVEVLSKTDAHQVKVEGTLDRDGVSVPYRITLTADDNIQVETQSFIGRWELIPGQGEVVDGARMRIKNGEAATVVLAALGRKIESGEIKPRVVPAAITGKDSLTLMPQLLGGGCTGSSLSAAEKSTIPGCQPTPDGFPRGRSEKVVAALRNLDAARAEALVNPRSLEKKGEPVPEDNDTQTREKDSGHGLLIHVFEGARGKWNAAVEAGRPDLLPGIREAFRQTVALVLGWGARVDACYGTLTKASTSFGNTTTVGGHVMQETISRGGYSYSDAIIETLVPKWSIDATTSWTYHWPLVEDFLATISTSVGNLTQKRAIQAEMRFHGLGSTWTNETRQVQDVEHELRGIVGGRHEASPAYPVCVRRAAENLFTRFCTDLRPDGGRGLDRTAVAFIDAIEASAADSIKERYASKATTADFHLHYPAMFLDIMRGLYRTGQLRPGDMPETERMLHAKVAEKAAAVAAHVAEGIGAVSGRDRSGSGASGSSGTITVTLDSSGSSMGVGSVGRGDAHALDAFARKLMGTPAGRAIVATEMATYLTGLTSFPEKMAYVRAVMQNEPELFVQLAPRLDERLRAALFASPSTNPSALCNLVVTPEALPASSYITLLAELVRLRPAVIEEVRKTLADGGRVGYGKVKDTLKAASDEAAAHLIQTCAELVCFRAAEVVSFPFFGESGSASMFRPLFNFALNGTNRGGALDVILLGTCDPMIRQRILAEMLTISDKQLSGVTELTLREMIRHAVNTESDQVGRIVKFAPTAYPKPDTWGVDDRWDTLRDTLQRDHRVKKQMAAEREAEQAAKRLAAERAGKTAGGGLRVGAVATPPPGTRGMPRPVPGVNPVLGVHGSK